MPVWTRALLLACVTGIVSMAPATPVCGDSPGSGWTWSHPLPQGHTLHAVANGQGWWFAVGERGAMITSRDGLTWSVHEPMTDQTLRGAAASMDGLVAVGDEGTILWSRSGDQWEILEQVTDKHLLAVTASSHGFLAAGQYGTLLASIDGRQWDRVEGIDSWLSLIDVAWNGSHYLVLADRGSVLLSSNGDHWRASPIGATAPIFGLAWDGEQWIAVGALGVIAASRDGIDWQVSRAPSYHTLTHVTAAEGVIVAVGFGAILTSRDAGATWGEVADRRVTGDGLYRIAWADGRFIAVGVLGSLAASDDGKRWQSVRAGSAVWINDLAETDEHLVAVGGSPARDAAPSRILVSPVDGGGWQEIEPPVPHPLTGVAGGGGVLVAVGDQKTILRSADGLFWQQRDPGLVMAYGFADVIWTGDRFIAVGTRGVVVASGDGNTWTRLPSGTRSSLYAITSGNGLLVIAGDRGTLLTSPDGDTWTKQRTPTSAPLLGVLWTGSRFIVVGTAGTVLTSPDGFTWSRIEPQTNRVLRGVARGCSELVAVGDHGSVFTSADGTLWESATSPTPRNLTSVLRVEDTLYVAGWHGVILQRSCAPGARLRNGGPRR